MRPRHATRAAVRAPSPMVIEPPLGPDLSPGARRAKRPSLSPALIAVCGACLGIAVGTRACLDAHFGHTAWGVADPRVACLLGCALACVALGALACVAPRLRATALLAVAGLVLGLVAGMTSATLTLRETGRLCATAASSLSVTIVSDPAPSATGGMHAYGEVRPARGDGFVARVWVSDAGDALVSLTVGDVVACVGRWAPFEDDDWGRSMLAQGVAARLTIVRAHGTGAQGGVIGAIRRLRAAALRACPTPDDPAIALTLGVVLGDQSPFGAAPAYDEFRNLGLSHLVAVSGSHLAVVTSLLVAALARTRLRPGARRTVTIVTLAGYVVLTGLQDSAIRSVVMTGIAFGAGMAHRRASSVSSLAVTALTLVLADPPMLFSLGFQLSALSVLGIAVFSPIAGEWVRFALPRRTPGFVRDALALTLVAQAFTMPVAIPAFGVLPLASPVANVLVGPLVGALLPVGMACVAVSLALPAAGGVAYAPCRVIGGVACWVAHALAGLPYAAVPLQLATPALVVGLVVPACAIYAAWPTPTRHRACTAALAIVCVLGACLMRWTVLAPERVDVLDVGQGDAILVQDGAHAMLVDAGPNAAIVQALGRAHVAHLDAVLLTHLDLDHVGGLAHLGGIVRIDRLVVADGVADTIARSHPELVAALRACHVREVTSVRAGSRLTVGDLLLEVVAPPGRVTGDENVDSLVTVVRRSFAPARGAPEGGAPADEAFAALLTGDAECDVIEPLAMTGAIGQVDVLKAGHHGSAVSASAPMMRALAPQLVVASAGEGNRYGHPTEEFRRTVNACGVPLLCTMWAGDVDIRPRRDGMRVICENGTWQANLRAGLPDA